MRAVVLRRHYRYWRRFRGSVGVLALLVLFAGVAAFSVSLHRPTETVTLPVEVIGPNGTTKAVTVEASDASSVQELYLRAHSIGYPDHVIEEQGYQTSKASIRINGGPWVDVDNRVASCEEPEESIGCITGPYHTIRFAIPIREFGGVRSGSNTIEFRFNYQSPDVSTGYRILDIELRTAGGRDAIDGTEFVWDDPAEWAPPSGYDSSGDISAGKELWHRRDFLVDGWDGPSIKAACSDCHAKNGRDLQYFAFSNESIVKRSEFHGLSEEEGKQIAAYIRSIDLKDSRGKSYDPPGRPWEPPYQPGPTALATRDQGDLRTAGESFYDIDQAYWAAGAGLDWALDDDHGSYPYVFPGGISYDDVDPFERQLHMPEIPVGIQMPDWNEWLPEHHPMDAYGDAFTDPDPPSSGFCSGRRIRAWEYYNGDYQTIDASTPPSQVEQRLNEFTARVASMEHCQEYLPREEGHSMSQSDADATRWRNIKLWEVLHGYSLEDLTPDLYRTGEPLAWPTNKRQMFDVAPHIVLGKTHTYKGHTDTPTASYFDTSWYQQQLTINSGHNENVGITPVDWNYHPQYILRFQGMSGVEQTVRYVMSFIEVLQAGPLAPEGSMRGDPKGWRLAGALSPYELQKFPFQRMDNVVDGGTCHTLNAALKVYADYLTEHDPDEWTRDADVNGHGQAREGIEGPGYKPVDRGVPGLSKPHPVADDFYTVLRWASEEVGVPASTIGPIAEWADRAWPKASPNFSERIDENASCPALPDIADDNPDDGDDDPQDDGGGYSAANRQ